MDPTAVQRAHEVAKKLANFLGGYRHEPPLSGNLLEKAKADKTTIPGLESLDDIAIRLADVDLDASVSLAHEQSIYA